MNRSDKSADYALIVDNHPLYAQGVSEHLIQHCGFHATAITTNKTEAFTHIKSHGAPSLILMDFFLPGNETLNLLYHSREHMTSTRLIVLSDREDNDKICMKSWMAGAHAFLMKYDPVAHFSNIVEQVMSGEIWFGDSDEATDIDHNPEGFESPFCQLEMTSRQSEVFRMMIWGYSNKRIAKLLNISEQTVKEHITRILGRIGVKNRVEAITLFNKHLLHM